MGEDAALSPWPVKLEGGVSTKSFGLRVLNGEL